MNPMKRKSLNSFDGTKITYEVGGNPEGRWLVVANGFGGSFWAWTDVFEILAPHYRILTWDYRGYYESDWPVDETNIKIEDNCRDLDCLMEAEGIRSMVMSGWSVGVQVSLEQYRRRPETVQALLLLNGAHGKVLERSMGGGVAAKILPLFVKGLGNFAPYITPLAFPPLKLFAHSRVALPVISGLGLVEGSPQAISTALQSVLELDYSQYARLVAAAHGHDTEDMLHTVKVPTLVTSGGRDVLTTPAVGRHVAASIPGAEYHEFPRGTHYTVMEFPEEVAQVVHDFMERRL